MVGDIVYSALIGHKLDRGLGGISWPIHLMVLGRLIPSQARIPLLGHLVCYFWTTAC